MATITIYGPYSLDLGDQGLAPGQTQGTYWLGFQPEPRDGDFTVTVTAHPSTLVAGTDRHEANALSVSETCVQYVPNVQGDIVTTSLVINAKLLNCGPAAIRFITLRISFITA